MADWPSITCKAYWANCQAMAYATPAPRGSHPTRSACRHGGNRGLANLCLDRPLRSNQVDYSFGRTLRKHVFTMEVAACAVTFGTVLAQIATAAVRLKHLWDEISGVPVRIQELLNDIQHIHLLFAEMENTISDPRYPNLPLSFWTGPLMQFSLARAKEALTALEVATNELNDRLKASRNGLRRKIIAIRGLMNKEKIQAYESKLARSVDLLWKSYDLFEHFHL